MYSLSVLEARSPKSKCQKNWFLLRALKNMFYPSLLASGNNQQSLAYRCIPPISASMFTVFSLCFHVFMWLFSYKDIISLDELSLLYDFMLINSATTLSPNKVTLTESQTPNISKLNLMIYRISIMVKLVYLRNTRWFYHLIYKPT